MLYTYALCSFESYWTPVILFVIILITSGMREVAAALSNPFGDDDVDFPVNKWIAQLRTMAVVVHPSNTLCAVPTPSGSSTPVQVRPRPKIEKKTNTMDQAAAAATAAGSCVAAAGMNTAAAGWNGALKTVSGAKAAGNSGASLTAAGMGSAKSLVASSSKAVTAKARGLTPATTKALKPTEAQRSIEAQQAWLSSEIAKESAADSAKVHL